MSIRPWGLGGPECQNGRTHEMYRAAPLKRHACEDKKKNKKGGARAQPESNRRPQDLQSHALPLSYAPEGEVLPGLEPGSKDSESLVMTNYTTGPMRRLPDSNR